MLKLSTLVPLVTLICVLTVGSAPVQASDSWFDKAKSILGLGDDEVEALTDAQIGEGLKEALSVGTESVLAKLGQVGGFANDSNLQIGLPDSLAQVSKALEKVGLGQYTADLEAKLNEAAEKAVPQAKPLLLKAIKDMKLEDIQGLYKGEDDALTRYFEKTMSGPIGEAMKPVIEQSLGDVGAAKLYQQALDKYHSIPLMPKIDGDLTQWVNAEAIKGIFANLAKEEAAIRNDPVKQSTELLKKLFGG